MSKTSKLIDLILRSRYVNYRIIAAFDVLLSVISTLLILAFTNSFFKMSISWENSLKLLGLSLIVSILSFWALRTYRGIIRHSGLLESFRLLVASFFKVVFLFIIIYLLGNYFTVRSLLILSVCDFFITFSILLLFRLAIIFVYRLINTNAYNSNVLRLVLVYVGDDTTSPLGADILEGLSRSYGVIGYLRFGKKISLRLGRHPLFSIENGNDFIKLIKEKHIHSILFTKREDINNERERLVRLCEKNHIQMLQLPTVNKIGDPSKTMMRRLPEVKIEDLLGRAEIKLDMQEVIDELKGKVVLVTGAAGSIGSELCRQLCTFGLKRLVLFDMAETPMHNIRLELEDKFPDMDIVPIIGDVRIAPRVDYVMREHKPYAIFHAAAYKHVPLMEENPCESVLSNVVGTRIVADTAVKYGVERFVMISTDKAVNPTNVMGASKRLAEIYVQTLSMSISKGEIQGKTKFITTRFGNVLGSNGSVIPRFREQLEKGGPLTVTHPEIIRYFMTIPEACRLVLEAAVMGQGNEIFVFDMGTPVKIADLARRMIDLAGLTPDVDIKIEYTGLRPGEKLYEELLATKENTLPTPNKKIFRAHVREYERDQVVAAIEKLKEVAETVDRVATVREMKKIVPEFKSKNSVYEELDKETSNV